jgi:hypothetical protein
MLFIQASIRDIEDFFRGYDFIPDSIRILQDHTRRPSGEVTVQFKSMEAAQQAISARNMQYMNSRYIKLFLQS